MPTLRLLDQDPPRSGQAPSSRELLAMQRAVANLFDRWELRDDEAAILLGGIAPRTYQRWKSGGHGRVGPDTAARLSNLLGIHKALRQLFRDKARAYGWVKRPNGDFGGESALDIMLRGQLTDLMRVRRYLDSQRGIW